MKNSKKRVPTYGKGKDMYVCTQDKDDNSTCLGDIMSPAHGPGATILYKVYADTWEEALVIHRRIQGFN